MNKTDKDYNKYLSFAQEMRTNYDELSLTAGTKDSLFSVENFEIIVESDQRRIPSRIYIPTKEPQAEAYPLVLFVHGGGWVSGTLDTHDVLARAISLHLNAVVLSVHYRLAPEVDAFQQIADVKEAFLWLHNNAEKFKGDQNKIIGIGDSAGGALIANISTQLDNHRLFAQWLMYPAIGFDISTPSAQKYGEQHFPTNEAMHLFWGSQLPEGVNNRDPRISPLFAKLENISPTLISVAGLDPLTSNSEAYHQALVTLGVKAEIKSYDESEHGFIQFFKDKKNHPLGQKAFDDGIDFLKSLLV